jgi:hypothetical protein
MWGLNPSVVTSNYFRRIIAKSRLPGSGARIRNAAVAISRCAFGSQSNKTHRRKSFAEWIKDNYSPQKSLVRPQKRGSRLSSGGILSATPNIYKSIFSEARLTFWQAQPASKSDLAEFRLIASNNLRASV